MRITVAKTATRRTPNRAVYLRWAGCWLELSPFLARGEHGSRSHGTADRVPLPGRRGHAAAQLVQGRCGEVLRPARTQLPQAQEEGQEPRGVVLRAQSDGLVEQKQPQGGWGGQAGDGIGATGGRVQPSIGAVVARRECSAADGGEGRF